MTPATSEFEAALRVQPLLISRSNESWVSDFPSKLVKTLKSVPSDKQRVVLIGTGSSFHVALWGEWMFRNAGVPAVAVKSFDVVTGLASRINRDDIVLVISHRGARGLTLEVLKKIGNHPRLAILSGADSPGAGRMQIYASFPEISKAHSQSLIGGMSVLSAILGILKPAAARAFDRDRDTMAETIAQIVGNAGTTPMTRILKLVKPATAIHVVGSGPCESIAREIALKAMEVGHVPAVPHHTEEFLHGPIAAVNRGDMVLFLNVANPKGDRELAFRRTEAGEKASRFVGANVVVPDLPENLHPASQSVLALCFGQVFCLQLSRRLKTNPDTNRQEDATYKKAFQLAEFRK